MDKSSDKTIEWFFDNPKNLRRLKKALSSWLGTPYRHKCGVKGKGVDCAHFIGCILVEIGAFESFEVSDYPMDLAFHGKEEGFANHLRNHPKLVEISTSRPVNGDIALYQAGRIAGHSAFFFDGYSWQANSRTGVEKFLWPQVRHKLRYGFRVIK